MVNTSPSAIAPILADRRMMLAGVRPQYRAGSGGRLKPETQTVRPMRLLQLRLMMNARNPRVTNFDAL